MVKGWIKLYNRDRAKSKPEITRRTVYIKNTLFSYRNGILKISIEPNRRYLRADLRKFGWIPSDFDKIGGLILTERELIVRIKKDVVLKEPGQWASFDINLTNITALINGRVVRYDLKQLYHIHRVYEIKRKRVQKLAKHKPRTSEIARELSEIKSGAILENLKSIKGGVLRKSKDLNRRLSKWNARTFQYMLEYKLKWLGLPVKYVNPKNSSKTCPLCRAEMSAYGGMLMKCKKCSLIIDRDVVAVLNLQMWGLGGVAPKALLEALASMMGKRLVDQNSHLSIKVYQPRTPRVLSVLRISQYT